MGAGPLSQAQIQWPHHGHAELARHIDSVSCICYFASEHDAEGGAGGLSEEGRARAQDLKETETDQAGEKAASHHKC